MRTDLYAADELFFTGTAADLTPIASVDNRPIGDPGPITRRLQERFFDIVQGKVAQYDAWLETV